MENISRDDLLRRGDVIDLLQQRASEAADYVLYGLAENARTREAQEAAFKAAQYAVAFMPASPLAPTMAPTGAGSDPWLPIESAPKDGTWVFGYWPTMPMTTYPCVMFWDGGEWASPAYTDFFPNPTLWHPMLPPPPAAGQDLSEGKAS